MILHDDCRHMNELPDNSVHCVVTSPPYWGLRKYDGAQDLIWGGDQKCTHDWVLNKFQINQVGAGKEQDYGIHDDRDVQTNTCRLCGCWRGALGLEKSPESYVAHIVEVMREVKRVLRPDGTLFLNIADSYANAVSKDSIIKPLDRVGIPEMVVLALRADGWFWRSTIIWNKTNPMPQAVHGWFWTKHKVKVGSIANKKQLTNPGSYTAISDGTTQAIWQDCPGCAECAPHGGLVLRKGAWRPTDSFEYVYQLTKTDKYYGDGQAVREDTPEYTFRFRNSGRYVNQDTIPSNDNHNGDTGEAHTLSGRNLRSVWTLSTQGFNLNMCKSCNAIFEQRRFARLPKQNDKRVCTCGASDWLSHFATFCESLVETCIKASTSEYGVCDKCGAPYARIIDEHRNYKSIGTNTTKTGTVIEVGKRYADWYTVETATLGWLQTCECQDPQPVGATVLDPFVGSGTTVLVAQKLGRRGIGYDLSEHYCKLAEYRIRQAGLL